MVDEKDNEDDGGILNKRIGRRGFLGALGAVGTAAAIPLRWNIGETAEELPYAEGPPPVEISEYVQPGTWENVPDLDVHEFETASTGKFEYKEYKHPTIEISKYLAHPDHGWKNISGPVLIGRYDLASYEITTYVDVVENTAFGDADRTYFSRGQTEAEVHCTLYGETYITELLKQLDRKLHVIIDLGPQTPIAFAFDTYATNVRHTLPPFVSSYGGGPIMGEVVFFVLGNMRRIHKGK